MWKIQETLVENSKEKKNPSSTTYLPRNDKEEQVSNCKLIKGRLQSEA